MEASGAPPVEPEMERPTKFGNVRMSEFEVNQVYSVSSVLILWPLAVAFFHNVMCFCV